MAFLFCTGGRVCFCSVMLVVPKSIIEGVFEDGVLVMLDDVGLFLCCCPYLNYLCSIGLAVEMCSS